MKFAIYGGLRSGKSAVAECLTEILDDCEVFEFGTPVQKVVDIIYPEYEGVKNRKLLVDVGQHLRKLDEDVWVRLLKRSVENSKAKNIIVVGVRQENEYKMLKDLGFTFIRVFADVSTRIERIKSLGDVFQEESFKDETELIMESFKPDHVLINNGTLKQLEADLVYLLCSIDKENYSQNLKWDALRVNSAQPKKCY